ncbi:MAG: InlB B-repeat-containing protein [Actinomycetota bacterium]
MRRIGGLSIRPRRAAATFGLALALTGLVPVAGLPTAAAAAPTLRPDTITAGANHTCALDTAGAAWCWGDDSSGQLGNGPTLTADQVSPTRVDITGALPDTYLSISAGATHTCAIATGGAAYCWGSDTSEQLGNGAGVGFTADQTSPSPVDTSDVAEPALVRPDTYASISAGGTATCAVASGGTAWCWGSDASGQLGDGDALTANQPSPSPVDTLAGLITSVSAISAGSAHACAIATTTVAGEPPIVTTDVAFCWGSNASGQVGDGTSAIGRSAPTAVDTLSGLITAFSKVSAGTSHTCAIVTTTVAGETPTVTPNLAYCWGADASGQLGDGAATASGSTSPTPVDIAGDALPDTYLAISAGDLHTCAIESANGAVYCWGERDDGRLGKTGPPPAADATSPVRAESLTGIGWVDAGGKHTCALVDAGTAPLATNQALCWGDDTDGQLGNSVATTGDQNGPGDVGTDLWVRKTGNGTGTVTSSGAGISCGTACLSQRGLAKWNVTAPGLVATADAGSTFRGYSGGGCLSASTCAAVAISPPATTVYAAFSSPTLDRIAAGESQSCALASSGAASCWGTDSVGELGNGATLGDQLSPSLVTPAPASAFASIATGKDHTCGVTTAGTLFCWGSDGAWQIGDGDEGQKGTTNGDGNELSPRQVNAATDWLQVATGALHTCAVKTTYALWCWGSNASGQLGDGTLTGRPVPTAVTTTSPLPATYLSVSAGTSHTCAIASGGAAYCWGGDANAQLGNGATTGNKSAPEPVDVSDTLSLTRPDQYLSISAGGAHTCAIAYDGTAWCWGSDGFGQLGDGATTGPQASPVAVSMPVGRTFVRIAAGLDHTCALADDGTIYCWGSDASGKLGDGATTGTQTVPTLVVGGFGPFTGVSAGYQHTCAATATPMYCWGDDTNGRLGNGSGITGSQGTPTLVGTNFRVLKAGTGTGAVTSTPAGISCDAACTAATAVFPFNDSVSLAYTTGSTFEGWFGPGCAAIQPTATCSPIASGTDPTVVASFSDGSETRLSAGATHGCAVSGSAAARLTWCWGDQTDGRLGNGQTSGIRAFPGLVNGGRVFTEVSAAPGPLTNSFSCALMREGTAWCWGYGALGQLGNGATASSSVPVPVTMPAQKTFTRIATGLSHACALTYDGLAYCWGSDVNGQLGNGGTTVSNQSTPVAVTMPAGRTFTRIAGGGSHTCALADNGAIYCWGADASGQLGDGGANTDQIAPVLVSGALAFTSIAAGFGHTCGTTSTTAYCWGSDANGQLGDDASLAAKAVPTAVAGGLTLASISAGRSHTCGLTASGAAWCWGESQYGRLGTGTEPAAATSVATPVVVAVPAGVSAFSAITAANLQTCAIAVDGFADGLDTAGPWCWGYDVNGQLGNSTTLTANQPSPSKVGADLILSKVGFGFSTATVTSSPVGIDCGTACASARMTVPFGTASNTLAVTLTSDTAVSSWTGCATSTSTTCLLTISSSQPVSATYAGTFPPITPLKVAAGEVHACAVNASGTGGCWGSDGNGRLGDGGANTDQVITSAVAMPASRTFLEISGGGAHTCALADNGRAYCWGSDGNGQLGNGATTGDQASPSLVSTVTTFTEISASAGASGSGSAHTCGLATVSSVGRIYCWGSDLYGQVGNGATTGDQAEPVLLALPSGVSGFARVSAGLNHTCALTDAGVAYCWGRDNFGQLGDAGTNTDQPSPVAVAGGLTFTEIAAGAYSTCAIATSGAAYCWGSDANGRLGNGTTLTADQPSPSAVSSAATFVQVSVGGAHACGVASDGKAWCWGRDVEGQLGNGSTTTTDQAAPVEATRPGGQTFVQVVAGNLFTCASLSDNSIRCWGSDASGQLGNDVAGNTTSPTLVQSRFAITIGGNGAGDVSTTAPLSLPCSYPTQSSCISTRAATLASTTTTYTGTPAVGSDPVAWSGACAGVVAGQTCERGLSWSTAIGATFTVTGTPSWTLTLNRTGNGTVTSAPSGISCGATCSASFLDETSVTLTAVPDAGWAVTSWTGCTPGANNTCTVVLLANTTVSVTFTQQFTLSITKSGTGTGVVATVGSTAINCGATCSATFASGTTVTLSATADTGSSFGTWTGCTSVSGTQCTVSMTASTTVNASFTSGYTLTVAVTNVSPGSGSVSSNLGGIACPATSCTQNYAPGTSVILTAAPVSGSLLQGWGGACSGTALTCTVLMDQAKSVTATFALARTLTVSKTGLGTLTSNPAGINCGTTCSASFADGSSVVLTATPSTGNAVGTWGGACSTVPVGTATCTVTMSGPLSASVTFVAASYALTVTKTLIGNGAGTVTSSPSGINCGTTCSFTFAGQTSVTLTASAASGSLFTGWSGACTNATGTCTVLMDQARSVTATFALSTALSVSKVYASYGTVTSSPTGINCGSVCSARFAYGTSVTLTATPNTGRKFVGWSGACSGTALTCTVTMTGNLSATATFGIA